MRLPRLKLILGGPLRHPHVSLQGHWLYHLRVLYSFWLNYQPSHQGQHIHNGLPVGFVLAGYPSSSPILSSTGQHVHRKPYQNQPNGKHANNDNNPFVTSVPNASARTYIPWITKLACYTSCVGAGWSGRIITAYSKDWKQTRRKKMASNHQVHGCNSEIVSAEVPHPSKF